MRAVCTFLVFLSVLALAASSPLTDAEISRVLVGTWTDDPAEQAPMHSRATYAADGTGFELVWPAGQPESRAVRVDTTWSVTHQNLMLKSVKSSDPKVVPVSLELRDHVVSISGDRFTFEPASGYEGRAVERKRHVKIRVEAGSDH